MPWKTFLKAHWGASAATDFFSVGVLTRAGWVRYFVLFAIDLKSRRVEIAAIAQQPDGREAVQEHDHLEGNHQGLENELVEDRRDELNIDGNVEYRERLGGVLKYYDRTAA